MPLAEPGQSLCRVGDGTLPGRPSHAFFQQFTQQPGNAGIPARRLDASPLGNVLFEGDGYIAEAIT